MPSTSSFARLTALALLTLALLALLPDCATACSCGTVPGTPQETLSGSKAVFSGEVVDFEKPPPAAKMIEGTMWTVVGGGGPEATVTLRVSEVWKGPRQQTMTVTTEADSGMGCGSCAPASAPAGASAAAASVLDSNTVLRCARMRTYLVGA